MVKNCRVDDCQKRLLVAALEQIKTVCIDNAGDTVRHDLALKFVGHVAEQTLLAVVGSATGERT